MIKGIDHTISQETISLLSAAQAWHYRIIPVKGSNTDICFRAEENCNQRELKEELELITGKRIALETSPIDDIEFLLSQYYPSEQFDSRQQNSYYSATGQVYWRNLYCTEI